MNSGDKQNLDYKVYLDVIRIFACFMVLVNHTLAARALYGSIPFWKLFIADISFGFCKTGVTLFLLVSGALLLKSKESYKKFL